MYFQSEDPEALHAQALKAGAKELCHLEMRNWGERVAYSMDLDGHVIAVVG